MELRMEQTARVRRGDIAFIFTPKAIRMEQLRSQGKSFDEAFAIADREFTPNGMALKPGQQLLPSDAVVQSATGTTVVKHGAEARAI
jgi:hypothetical protein